MEADTAAAGEFYEPYTDYPNIWAAIKAAALEKADRLVRGERAAVLALKAALVSHGGILAGRAAESIIAANRNDARNGAQNGAH